MSCACHSSLRRDGGKFFTSEVVFHARHQAALSVKSCAFLRRKFIFQAGTSSSSPDSIWISRSSIVCHASTQMGNPGSFFPGLWLRNRCTQSSQA